MLFCFVAMETRKEKFKRLATYRTNNILHTLRLLGNLSNKSNYDYDEEDIKKIFSTIDLELRKAKTKYLTNRNTNFKL